MPWCSGGIASISGAASPIRSGLESADEDEATPVVLQIEQRIRDRDRHLVPQLGRAHRVGVDQDIGHRASDPIVLCDGDLPARGRGRVRELLDALERPVELLVALGPEETPLPGARDIDFGARDQRVVVGARRTSGNLTWRASRTSRPASSATPPSPCCRRARTSASATTGSPGATSSARSWARCSRPGSASRRSRPSRSSASTALDKRPRDRRLRHTDLTPLPAGRAAGVPSRARLTADHGLGDRGDRVPGARRRDGRLVGAADRGERRATVGRRRSRAGLPRPRPRARLRLGTRG